MASDSLWNDPGLIVLIVVLSVVLLAALICLFFACINVDPWGGMRNCVQTFLCCWCCTWWCRGDAESDSEGEESSGETAAKAGAKKKKKKRKKEGEERHGLLPLLQMAILDRLQQRAKEEMQKDAKRCRRSGWTEDPLIEEARHSRDWV